MRQYVYSFVPKGKGYRLYRNKTIHNTRKNNERTKPGLLSNTVADIAARVMVGAITDDKKVKKI